MTLHLVSFQTYWELVKFVNDQSIPQANIQHIERTDATVQLLYWV